MHMITITVPVTVHRPRPGHFDRRVEGRGLGFIDENGIYRGDRLPVALGPDEIDTVPPNVPFEIEEAEGVALVARHGGKVIRWHE